MFHCYSPANWVRSLTELNLSGNRIKDDGATALGRGLRCNSALRTLCLENNPIRDRGVAGLAEGLGGNAALARLAVVGSPFKEAGAVALARAVRGHASMGVCEADRRWASPIPATHSIWTPWTAGKGMDMLQCRSSE